MTAAARAAAARTALRVMDEHRDGLGATDLRAHASGHRAEVATFGLRMAFDSGQPARVLEWAEQGRASHLTLRPVRPPSDPVLAAALSELRATVSEIFRLRGSGGNTAALARRQVELERRIRDYHRRLPAGQADAPSRARLVPTLRDALREAALLEFVELDGTLYAVTVAGGRIRLCPLGPAARAADLIDRARFALHRLARHQPSEASKDAARVLLADAAERLDDLLLRPVARETADRPLVVVPTGALQSLPWSILPSCHGRPVTVTPSAALWSGGRPDQARPGNGPVLVAAGPGLPGADAEARAVSALHQVTALAGPAATVDVVTARLNGASLAHLAAHGRIHPNNPLFTSLTFADGPLTVYDVERISQAPQVVVLSACDVGRSAVRAGDEIMGRQRHVPGPRGAARRRLGRPRTGRRDGAADDRVPPAPGRRPAPDVRPGRGAAAAGRRPAGRDGRGGRFREHRHQRGPGGVGDASGAGGAGGVRPEIGRFACISSPRRHSSLGKGTQPPGCGGIPG